MDYIWTSDTGKQPVQLPPAGFVAVNPWGINDHNAYVGALDPSGCCFDTTAFYVDPAGNLIVIDAYSASDVNNRGQVTGSGYGGQAYVWDEVNGLQLIGSVENESFSGGSSINENGVVVGNGRTFQFFPNTSISYTPFKWDAINGKAELDTLGSSIAFASDINDSNVAVGRISIGSSDQVAVYWDEGNSIHILPKLTGDLSSYAANAISDSGVIVGTARASRTSTAIVWRDGIAYDVNALVDPSDPLYGTVFFDQAFDVNDSGQILVSSANEDFTEFTTYLLTPVPIPGAVLLFGSSLMCLVIARKKLI